MRSFAILVLGLLKRLGMRLVPPGWRHQVEARHWEAVDLKSARQVSWDSIECLGRMAVHEMTGGRWEQTMDVISMHHFERIDHIVEQIDGLLKPGGLWVAWEHVGPRHQRFSRRQRRHANMVLRACRPGIDGNATGAHATRPRAQSLLFMSPDEAIRSDRILPALERMDILYQYNWDGLLFPLLRGDIAANFCQDDPEDRRVIDCLFQLDRLLCQSEQVEPNFTITIAAKSSDGPAGSRSRCYTVEEKDAS